MMKKVVIIILGIIIYCACSDDNGPTFVDPEVSFFEFTDERDSSIYKCMKIGDQTWMLENLAYRLPLGSLDGCYTYGEGSIDTSKITINREKFDDSLRMAVERGEIPEEPGAWFQPADILLMYLDYGFTYEELYDYLSSYPDIIALMDRVKVNLIPVAIAETAVANLTRAERRNSYYSTKYGFLYTLEAAENAVPEGWRVPTDDDWKKLEEYLGMVHNLIDKMEEWRSLDGGEWLKRLVDEEGFEIKLGGTRAYGTFMNGSPYMNEDINGYYWSSTQVVQNDSTNWGVIRKFTKERDEVYRGTSRLTAAYNVRCIKK